MNSLVDTLIKGLGVGGFIVVLVLLLMGTFLLVVFLLYSVRKFKLKLGILGTTIQAPEDTLTSPKNHMECALKDDISEIVAAVKEGSYKIFELLYLNTRAKQMGTIDDGLSRYKTKMENQYMAHLKRNKPDLSPDEVVDSVIVYHILSESIIRKLVNEIRMHIMRDNPFSILDPVEWKRKKTGIVQSVISISESEADKYFPRRLLITCCVASDFFTTERKRELADHLEEVLDTCRDYQTQASIQEDANSVVLRERLKKIIHKEQSTKEDFLASVDKAVG